MDLTKKTGYYLFYTEDPLTGVYTINICDLANHAMVYGTIIVEKSKARALLSSLAEIGKGMTSSMVLPATLIQTVNSYGYVDMGAPDRDIIIADLAEHPSQFTPVKEGDLLMIAGTSSYDGSYTVTEKIDDQRIRVNKSFPSVPSIVLDGKYTVIRKLWTSYETMFTNTLEATTEFNL